MKTIAKVLESMLSKPAIPTWDTTRHPAPTLPAQLGPTQIWGWGGGSAMD
jgi:hypothetical protein